MKDFLKKHGTSLALAFFVVLILLWVVYTSNSGDEYAAQPTNCPCNMESLTYAAGSQAMNMNSLTAATNLVNEQQMRDEAARKRQREGIYTSPDNYEHPAKMAMKKVEGFTSDSRPAKTFGAIKDEGGKSPFIGMLRM